MPKYEKIHPVDHSAAHMFDLVADIEAYPEFVPLCESLTIRSRREKNGHEILIADMAVGYKAIRERFTTQVALNRAARVIEVKYLDGPFRYLQNRWEFIEKGPSRCEVHFFIDYQFKSRMLGMLMGTMFDTAFRRFTAAFEARADALYGKAPPPDTV